MAGAQPGTTPWNPKNQPQAEATVSSTRRTGSIPQRKPHWFGMSARIGVLAFLSVAITTILLGWLGQRQQVSVAMEGVDAQLRAVASLVPAVVGQDLPARISLGNVGPAQLSEAQQKMTDLAAGAHVTNLFLCIESPGQDAIVLGNVEPRKAAGVLMRAREKRAWPVKSDGDLPGQAASVLDGQSTDIGDYRAIYIPGQTAAGTGYVVGAEVSLAEIHGQTMDHMTSMAASGTLVAIAVGSIGLLAGRKIARPIVQLNRDIETFTDGDFSNDQESIAKLGQLVKSERSETGDLAYAFLYMRQSLDDHIRELTRVTAEKQRIVGQLEVARHIQRGLLPEQSPTVDGFDIAGWSEAADQTGGDFYDWCPTAAGNWLIALADATGHGIGPAIMASLCRAYARATLCDSMPLAPLVGKLNALVHADTKGTQFVTFFAGVLDAAERSITMLSAGHGPLLFLRTDSGEVISPTVHGPPLGVLDQLDPDPDTILTFATRDVLLLVSDGFFEWRNTAGEQFGIERLTDELKASADQPADKIIEHLRRCVLSFTAGTVQPDDMTAVVIKCIA